MGASAEDVALFEDAPAKPAGKGGASAEDIALFEDTPALSTTSAHAPGLTKDLGPEARRALEPSRGMRPAPKFDDVSDEDVRPDYTKKNVMAIIGGRQSDERITLPERTEENRLRREANDPIAHDPLAGMIVQGIPAAGAGAVAAGLSRAAGAAPWLTRIAAGGTSGAVSSPDHPLVGAALGALPGVPGAARAAEQKIGEKALERSLSQPTSGTAAKLVGQGIGAAAGHAVGGPVGGFAGIWAGGKATDAITKLGNGLAEKLASRHLARLAATAEPAVVSDVAGRMAGNATRQLPSAGEPLPFPSNPELEPLPPAEPRAAQPPRTSEVPGIAKESDDQFWRAAQREWGASPRNGILPGNHTTAGGKTNPLGANPADEAAALRAEGEDALAQMQALRDAGKKYPPAALRDKVLRVTKRLNELEAEVPYKDKVLGDVKRGTRLLKAVTDADEE